MPRCELLHSSWTFAHATLLISQLFIAISQAQHIIESIINRIIKKKNDYDLYPDLLEQLGIDKPLEDKKQYIRYGAPVESGRGFILHSDDMIRKETLNIDKGVALTSTAEFFDDFSLGKSPKNSILALGYAGWGPGQLEKEIIHNSWMTLSLDSSFFFDEEVSKKWSQAYKLIGIDPNNLSQFSGRA